MVRPTTFIQRLTLEILQIFPDAKGISNGWKGVILQRLTSAAEHFEGVLHGAFPFVSWQSLPNMTPLSTAGFEK